MGDGENGILNLGEGEKRPGHENQPGLTVKRGDDPLVLNPPVQPYPAPLMDNKGPK